MASAGVNESNRCNASDFIGECSVTRSCEPCMKTNTSKTARFLCKDCQEFLCETCRNPHIAYKSGQHGMVNVQECESSHVVVDMKGMDICNDHGKAFEFFCEDHSKLCCTTCVITHRRCDKLDEISTMSLQKGAELDNLKQCLLKLEADADAYVIECKQSETQLTESIRDTSKEVEDLADCCIKQIEEAKRAFMTKANALKNEEIKRLNDNHAANTKVKDEINELLSIFSAISKQGTFQQKYIFSKQIVEKYKTIGSDINEQRTMHVSKKVTLSYPKALSSFLEMGKDFFKVKLERTDNSCNKPPLPLPVKVFKGPPPLPPKIPLKDKLIVRALYDFDAIMDDDLSFKKDNKLEVDKETAQNSDWWVATHFGTDKRGYIPSNYVTKDDNSPQSQDWWYSVESKEADKQLLLPGNPTGTFLVREAEDRASFVLSVRDHDPKSNDACLKHYRIRRLDNGGFYISPKRTFDDMLDLVFHYRNAADGLCCKLEVPCPKIRPMVQFRELEVERNSVKLNKKLGSCCFGDVWAGKWHNTVDVAVKSLKPGQMTPEAFLEEAKVMHLLRHQKLVQLMAVCTKTEPIWIITELMVNGALLDYLQKDEGRTITFNIIADMAGQIADGMAYLEAENFVHCDLRAANILVGEHNEVKVADFGLARIIQGDIYEAPENTKFAIKWTAPEAAFDRKFSIKSDVWSYGVLLYELITFGRVPYPGMNGLDVLNRVEKGFRMPRPTGGPVACPDPYYEHMLKCWNRSPVTRPTFAYLQDFFNNYMVSAEGEYKPMD